MSDAGRFSTRFIGEQMPPPCALDCPATLDQCERIDCAPGMCWRKAISDCAEALELFGDDILEAGL